MPATHGKAAVFKIQDSSGSTQTISAYVTKVELKRVVDTAETTTLGATGKSYVPGVPDFTLSVEGVFDPIVQGYLDGIVGFATARTFEFGPQGTTSTLPKYTGSVIATDFTPASDIGDASKWSFSAQGTGTLTVGAY